MKVEIAVIATIMTMAGPTNPASTAACPMTSAPTMETACPMVRGIRMPASRRISNVTSINMASINAGKGIPSRCAAILMSNVVGIISW
ncbi:hypothetical protein D3C85_1655910 [compost metagenome]